VKDIEREREREREREISGLLTFVEQKSSAGDDAVPIDPLLKYAASSRVDPRLELFARERAVPRRFACEPAVQL